MAAEGLSYRIRSATPEDAPKLREISAKTLAHPDGRTRREGYVAAAQREELLVLERYDSRARDFRVCALAEWHMRVDDVLTIRDLATEGDAPHPLMVKQLVNELIQSLTPVEVGLKVRGDAAAWNEIIGSIAGFVMEGTEYRRPNWINVWKWTRDQETRAARIQRPPRFQR